MPADVDHLALGSIMEHNIIPGLVADSVID